MDQDSAFARKAYARVDARLIPLLFWCYILAYLDRVNVGFAKLQMLDVLGLSDAAFAAGAGIFFIGYFFFEVPSNVLLKKFGARKWIARIMISWGLISTAMMGVTSEWAFYAMRFALGVAEAGFFPGIIYYLTLWYPAGLQARRNAWFASAVAVAGVIGNPVSGLIMDALSGTWGLAGWQWLFVAEGLPSVATGIWVYFRLDSSIAEAAWLTSAQKDLLEANIRAGETGKRAHRLGDALTSARVYLLCAVYCALTIGLYGITFWLPSIVAALGAGSYLEVGLVSAIPYTAALAGMLVLSAHSDATGERRLHLSGALGTGAAGLVFAGVFAHDPVWSVVGISLAAMGVIGAIPVFWPVPAAFLTGTAAAAGIGLVNSLGNLGGYVGPNVPIWTASLSPDPSSPLYCIAAILLTGAALAFVHIPRDLRGGRPPGLALDDGKA